MALPYFDIQACPVCGKNFISERKSGRRRKYCSNLCRVNDITKIAKENRRKSLGEPRICLGCGKLFKLSSVRQKLKKYCSVSCKLHHYDRIYAESRKERRIELKIEFVARLGGKCQLCGWNEWLSGLEFHHVEELNKGQRKRDKTELPLFKEFDLTKVVLVCSCCHNRIHSELKNDEGTQNRLKNLLMENNKKIEAEKSLNRDLTPI